MTRTVVISQLPPPLHGSTMMTKVLLDCLGHLGVSWQLVDRRFSNTISDVGRFSLRKAASAAWMPVRLLATIARLRPDSCVFFVTNRSMSFLVDCVLAEVLRITVKQRVLYVHTSGYQELASRGLIWKILVKRLLSSATDIVTLGASLASDIAFGAGKARVWLIPNTTNGYVTESQGRASDQQRLALFLSNLIPEKGAETFVEIALAVAPQEPTARFLVAGASPSREYTAGLAKTVENSNSPDQVEFLGAITDQHEKWRLLSEASVLVFPSTYRFEAQPLTILEALSVGTPVVAYAVGGITDVVEDGHNGYVVAAGRSDLMIERVREILTASHDSLATRKEIAADFNENYSLDAYRSKWQQVLIDRDSSC